MAYAFNGQSFGHVIGDAERLLASVRHQERELSSLSDLLENDLLTDISSSAGGTATAHASVGAKPVGALLETVARLRFAVGEQRQFAEAFLARLLGGQVANGVEPAKPRLLIVDDSDTNREITAAILEDAGFDIVTATNGLEGVIVAHYIRPSVILMDVTMPVMNGLEAVRLIRASGATQDLKVIAYTARPDLFDGEMPQWFTDVILKPASPETIVARVQRVIALDSPP